jgi:long chain fatty acid CoA FadD26
MTSILTDNEILDLPTMLARRAAESPGAVAYSIAGPHGEEVLTYGELEVAARARAANLLDRCLDGTSAVLLYPTGVEFPKALLACQLAGVAAAPVKVPNRRTGLQRVSAVADDAGARAILTTSEVRRQLQERFGDMPELHGLMWIETDTIPDGHAPAFLPAAVDPDGIGMLQYTSGSTGVPKGVMVTHRNFCANAADLETRWPTTDGGRVVSWLPLFHDMGLLFGIVLPLWSGIPAYLSSPDDFVRRPMRWLERIQQVRGTHIAMPNLGYELCVQAAPDAPATLDLSSMRAAINGSEPVRWSTIQRFEAAFAPFGFVPDAACPGYGLAENTLKVSGSRSGEPPRVLRLSAAGLSARRVVFADAGDKDATPMVGCGRPDGLTGVAIVDPGTRRRCRQGEVGEIWLSGPCVAAGYFGKPVETAETFHAVIAGEELGARHLRTGDLGFLHDGELFIAGRLKDVIIRFGRNHYPQDIEQTVERCAPGLQPSCAAAFPVDHDDVEELVVVVEVNGKVLKETPGEDLIERICARVESRHAIPVADVVLIRRGSLPRTSSGKVQRRACRAAYLDGTLSTVSAPQPSVAVAGGQR